MRKLLKTLLLAVCLLGGENYAGAQTTSVGTDNTTGWWTAFSDYYTLNTNQTLTLTFKNYSDKEANFHNWIAVLTNDYDRNTAGYTEYLLLRADNYGWQPTEANTRTKTTGAYTENTVEDEDITSYGNDNDWFTSLTSNFNWDTFKNDMDGSTVVMTIKREWAKVTVRADITTSNETSYYEEFVMNIGLGAYPIRAFLTTECGHLTNITSSITSTSSIEESTAIYERGTSVRPWIETDVSGWVKTGDGACTLSVNENDGLYLSGSSQKKNFIETYTIADPAENALRTFDIVWSPGSTNGNNANWVYLTIGSNIKIMATAQGQTAKYIFGESETTISNACSKNNGNRYNDLWTIHCTVNTTTNELYNFTIQGSDGNTKVNVNVDEVVDLPEGTTYNTIALGYQHGGGGTVANCNTSIKSVKITEKTTAVITTEFVDGSNNKLLSDVVSEATINSSFTPTYPATINTEFKQYTYSSGGGSATVADDVTRTIVYDSAWQEYYEDYTIHVAEDYEIAAASVSNWSTSTGGRFTPVILESNGNRYMSVNQDQRNNNGCTLTGTLVKDKVTAGNNFTMEFDLQLTSSNNQFPTSFTIKDQANSATVFSLTAEGVSATKWIVNENSDQKVTMSASTWYHIFLVRNTEDEVTSTYLTITKKDDSSLVFAKATISTLSSTGGLGNMEFVTSRYNANIAMDNILVRDVEDGDVPQAATTYTITHVDESDNTIGEDREIDSFVGEVVSAEASDMVDIYENGNKYMYDSGNDPLTLTSNTATNVIKLVYRTATIYHYSVNAKIGNSVVHKYADNEVYYEDDAAITVPYTHYLLNNGTLYAASSTSSEYRKTFTPDADNYEVTISYSSSMTNTVFFSEGEDIEGASTYTSNNVPIRASQAAVGTHSGNLTLVSDLPAGSYRLLVGTFRTGSSNQTSTFTIGDNVLSYTTTGANLNEKLLDEFTITEASDVVWNGGGYLDYIAIIQTAARATLDSKGFATFACGYPLDLTADGLPTGLTAYKAAISGTRVIFTELDQTVPANTGVLLRGTANESYNIPLVASGTTVTENAFLVNTTGSTFEADMNFNYFAMKKNNYPLIFALFDPSVLAIPATKAFLKISKENGSRLTCVFANDDETITGVQTVTQEGQPKGQAYNLQGQRVEQLRSGCLYIVDGKKIIKK